MALYTLTLKPTFQETLSKYQDYNTMFVIRAEHPSMARRMAAKRAMDEGKEAWLDTSKSLCKKLHEDGAMTIIATESWAHP